MITIDKYGQSVKIYDGEVNMFFDREPMLRGCYIIKSTGIVYILNYIFGHYTDFVINGVPITTIEEFTEQYALVIPLECGGSGGGERFGIEDTTGVQERQNALGEFGLTIVAGDVNLAGVAGQIFVNKLTAYLLSVDTSGNVAQLQVINGGATMSATGGANISSAIEMIGNQVALNQSDAENVINSIFFPRPTAAPGNSYFALSFQGVKADSAGNIEPYKVYTALMNQSGTSAPVATVLQNTLGAPIVWTRTDVGLYNGACSANVFDLNKTAFFTAKGGQVFIDVFDTNNVIMETLNQFTGDDSDDKLSFTTIEIRVYP